MNRKLLFILCFFIGNSYCSSKESFVYQYHITSNVTFDFTKSYSVDLGSITLLNEENKTKKFRYIRHSPHGYFFNTKTKKIKRLTMVTHNAGKRKLDSIFWALLDSATYYYPVQPYGSTQLTAYLNLNFYPRPKEIIEYVVRNYKDLEYHIFSPMNDSEGENKPPDVKVTIQVIPCKHASFCQ